MKPMYWIEVEDEDGVRIEPREALTGLVEIWNKRWCIKDREGGLSVSTVFLGIDHGWLRDPNAAPLVYESMVFGLPDDDEVQQRYGSREAAIEGHAVLCRKYLNREPKKG